MKVRTAPNRIPRRPHQRALKHLAVNALTRIAAGSIMRLGFLTNDDPRYAHLNKHVWAAGAAASTLLCETGTCSLDGEPVE